MTLDPSGCSCCGCVLAHTASLRAVILLYTCNDGMHPGAGSIQGCHLGIRGYHGLYHHIVGWLVVTHRATLPSTHSAPFTCRLTLRPRPIWHTHTHILAFGLGYVGIGCQRDSWHRTFHTLIPLPYGYPSLSMSHPISWGWPHHRSVPWL